MCRLTTVTLGASNSCRLKGIVEQRLELNRLSAGIPKPVFPGIPYTIPWRKWALPRRLLSPQPGPKRGESQRLNSEFRGALRSNKVAPRNVGAGERQRFFPEGFLEEPIEMGH